MRNSQPTNTSARELSRAVGLHQAGRLRQAEQIYKDIISAEPENANALHLLGVVAQQSGNPLVAVSLIQKAIEFNPRQPTYFINLGNSLQHLSRFDEAAEAYKGAVGVDLNNVAGHVCLANIQCKLGQYANAISSARRAIEIDPINVEAYENLGVALQHTDKLHDAITAYRRAIDLKPDASANHNNLGFALFETGEFDLAIEALGRAIELDPDFAPAHYNLGNAYKDSGRPEDAIESFRRAVELTPTQWEANVGLGIALQMTGRTMEAHDAYSKALEINPRSALANNNMGSVLQRLGQPAEAVRVFSRAIDINPDFLEPRGNLAYIHEQGNQLDEARAALEAGLARAPLDPLLNLVAAKIERRDGQESQAIERLLRIRDLAPDSPVIESISYLLGRLHERQGETDKAFAAFTTANAMGAARPLRKYADKDRYTANIDTLIDRFDAKWVGSWTDSAAGATDRVPVFLVGFPRSGTTLLDQILDSHPGIQTVEEKPILHALRNELEVNHGGYPDGLATLTDRDIAGLRGKYFELAAEVVDLEPGKILIDKFPLNTPEIGLAHRLFPEAKIIFALRHPLDVCLSCFMQEFEINEAMASFLTLEDTAALYVRVMTLWRRYRDALPLEHTIVRYEDVTTDLEGTARGLLDFLGLEWDPAVLDYAKHAGEKEAIHTPSYDQVTQPIYSHAHDRWKRYAAHLAPIIETVRPFCEEFGYDLEG